MDENNKETTESRDFSSLYSDRIMPEAAPAKKNKRTVLPIAVAVIFVCVLCFVGGVVLGSGTPGSTVNGTSSTVSSESGKAQSASSDPDAYHFETQSSGESFSVATIAAKTMDSVVEITTETLTTGNFMQQYVTEGAGSGVIIRNDGIIVTNHHVIDGASSIYVRLRSGEEYSATLLGTDSVTDIALLKIEASGLSAAVLGNSDTLTVGSRVVAIGNPLGSLGGTVTDGIISALERQISIDGQSMTLLQTNAAINPGNSGGGLFNEAGELIAVVNAKSSGEGIEGLGFAIPINIARPVFEDLLNYGYVKNRVSLGVNLLDIYSDSYVRYYGVPSQGTYINSVEKGSDAEKAGLKSADMIKTVNGVKVTSSSVVTNILKSCKIGDTVSVTVIRVKSSGWFGQYETEELNFTITLTEYIPGSSLTN